MNLSSIQSNDPARYQRIMQIEQQVANYSNNRQQSSINNQIITIPVVVHVLHNGEAIETGLNISDAQIQSQIDVLNDDFRRQKHTLTDNQSSFLQFQ